MRRYALLLYLSCWISVSISEPESCSREASRTVREYFTRALGPIYEKNRLAIPLECLLSPMRDLFYQQELHKSKLSNDKWLCKYCNKTFYSEFYLDLHYQNRHNNTLTINNKTVCLADYCSIFRCEILRKPKRSLKSLNPLAKRSMPTKRKKKKVINEQQLTDLRTQCASIINRCIPPHVHYDSRVNLHNQMYSEICAYLTSQRYFELPNYRKPLVNFSLVFCIVIFLGMCLVAVGVVTHSDWKFDEPDDQQRSKPTNRSNQEPHSQIDASSSKSHDPSQTTKTSESTLRQRMPFKGHVGPCQHGHNHHPHHSHVHN